MMQKEVLFLAKEQLAVDLNCRREDFDRPGLQFSPLRRCRAAAHSPSGSQRWSWLVSERGR